MSPRRTILKTLSSRYQEAGEAVLTRPSTIPGFQKEPERFQKAVNTLLQARLIDGAKDQEGRLAIALNPHNMEAVRRELRPFWGNPVFWALFLLMTLALAGMGLSA